MNDEFNNYNNDENNIDLAEDYNKIINGKAIIIDVEPPKKKSFMKNFSKIIVSAAIFGLVAGASFQGYNSIISNEYNLEGSSSGDNSLADGDLISTDSDITNGVVAIETGTSNGTVTSDVSTVVEDVMPAIVAINSVVSQVSSDMFGRQYNQEVEGSGSGIIIGQNDSEILIVTNNHVVDGANSVEIVFVDDTTAQATIKGTAPASDLAVVSVNINDLEQDTIDNIKIATLGDSDTTKLGEMAIAIGNALGYGQSITVGYISALDREVTIDNITLNVLQTDAAINPGNSGGALLNSKGEVIGINSVKYVDDSVESIGYAIPISDAIPVINELMNRTTLEETEKAYLGVAGKDVTSAYSQSFNMPIGVYVAEVTKDSAAESAGIKVGDIITAINNITIETKADLEDVLNYTKAGDTGTITLKVLEDGQYVDKTLEITFDSRSSN